VEQGASEGIGGNKTDGCLHSMKRGTLVRGQSGEGNSDARKRSRRGKYYEKKNGSVRDKGKPARKSREPIQLIEANVRGACSVERRKGRIYLLRNHSGERTMGKEDDVFSWQRTKESKGRRLSTRWQSRGRQS